MATYTQLPKGARLVGDVSINRQLSRPLSRRDYSYWQGDLYLHEGRAYVEGVGGPASPFSERVPQANASIGGRGVIRVAIDIAQDWAQRAGIEDAELKALADRAEAADRAYQEECERWDEERAAGWR